MSKDLQPGDLLSPENLCIVRPGDGLPSNLFHALLGRPVARPLKRGTPINWAIR